MTKPTKWKIAAYVAAWIAALLATDPTCSLLPLAYMFPLGLPAFFVAPEHRSSPGWLVLGVTVAGYVALAVFYFRTRNNRGALTLFLIFVAALICNVAGCHEMIHAH